MAKREPHTPEMPHPNEHCLENLVKEVAMKDQQLFEKHEELEKLQARVQDAQLHFVRVEASLQTLQNLHSQSQEEQNAVALEVKNWLNKRYQALMEQVESVGLNPECITSSMRDLQDENTKLR
ncbi:Protein NETWORKED 1A [Camellia lanceoleosa]|uniref:Protein NETWORKED 1A n=1 Tax=Camellia lanceoleosa TaxID=1840588 RepID=A0ACC0FYF4_9ERIC|nr:Protein NETWORKED 1A [Camellia lanceoleosa]